MTGRRLGRLALAGLVLDLAVLTPLTLLLFRLVAHEAPASAQTVQVSAPAWDSHLARQFVGCAAMSEFPGGVIPAAVVVAAPGRPPSRMAFSRAWEVTHNDVSSDDVWVIGGCHR